MSKSIKKGGARYITKLRRASQLFFLLLFLYGGMLGANKFFNKTGSLESEMDLEAAKLNENLEKDKRIFLFMPIKSCKNMDKEAALLQGCSLFMFTNVLTYHTFLAHAVPVLFAIALAVLFGRTLCGWACPIGFIQEMLAAVRKKLRIGHVRLSRSVNRFLRRFRYAWLSIIFLVSLVVALPVFATIRKDLFNLSCLVCPSRYVLMWFPKVRPSLFSFQSPYWAAGAVIVMVFIGVLIASFFINRFWCRICPNGAFLSLFNKGCFTTKEKDLQKCTKCGICYRVCPVENEAVYESRDRKVVNSGNCVMCFKCVKHCPENGCLTVRFMGKKVVASSYGK
jgi:polyferredoxin